RGWQSLLAYGCQNFVVVFDPKSVQIIQVLNLHTAPCTKVKWARDNYHHDLNSPYILRLASGDAAGNVILWGIPLMCQDWILFINDFSINRAPESNGRKFYLTNSASTSPSNSFIGSPITGSESKNTGKPSTPRSALGKMRQWAGGESRSRTGEESVALSDCLQLAYLPSARHHLLALFPREVMILDMEINQAVCSFSLERNSPSFVQVIPCQQRDVLMCLHESGSVIMRVRRRVAKNPYFVEPGDEASSDANTSVDIIYENKCQSDPLRLSKSSRLFGFMCCPISERKLALLISDGRVIIWELKTTRLQTSEFSLMSEEAMQASLPTEVQQSHLKYIVNPKLMLSNVIPPPMSSGMVIPNSAHFKFIMTGLSSNVSSPPTCAVMCPPLTTKNFSNYKPLIAVGMYKQLRQYFIVIIKDRSLQLWDLKNLTVLREMPSSFNSITALEWSPSHSKHHKKKLNQQLEMSPSGIAANVLDSGKTADNSQQQHTWLREHFVCVDRDKLLYHFLVEGTVVKDGSKVQCDNTLGLVTYIAWKGDLLVLSDTDGNLSIWELKARITRALVTHRGHIKKIKFGPGKGNQKLAALYADGIDIWDLQKFELLSSYKLAKDSLPSVDMDWLASDLPIVTLSNGAILVMTIDLKTTTSAMAEMDFDGPLWCPHIMEPRLSLIMKSILQHSLGRDHYSLSDLTDLFFRSITDQLENPPLRTAQKCFLTAYLFGDEGETLFWQVALHYLRREKARLQCMKHKTEHQSCPYSRVRSDSFDFFNPSESTSKIKRSLSARSLDLLSIDDDLDFSGREETDTTSNAPCCCYPICLDTCYDIISDTDAFQKSQLDRLALHDSKRTTYEQTRKCAETLVLMGQADRAVQLFLETDAVNENYYVDSLRACLVATIRSSGASQSTIKLVATNLIASGKLKEGVQLLCLIDKGLDACRYLQTYGEWDSAAWLAKATLNYPDCAEVMRRWIEHLSSTHTSQQGKAVLVWLSLGKFYKALDMLYSMRYFDRAALFAEACQEFGFLSPEEENNTALVHAVYTEYARYLRGLGLNKAAYFFAGKVGPRAKQLLDGF
ncbi:PREDICTED: WD repeat-containing protein 11-like, partial [Acropora digitifera]|uniref:WD repeat-containing protein 11-like n=1 Tax=Acropora digitifera TaxID=70779 RepID=UPI000779F268